MTEERPDRRRRAEARGDARVVRTGLALRAALLGLLERKPFDQVTIRDIAATAGISYATFFRHYASKEALLDHVAADQIERLVALTVPVLDTMDSVAAVTALCRYVDEHRLLWTTLLTGGAAGTMRGELLRVSREVAVTRAPRDGWLPVELGVACTTALIVETLAWWLSRPAGAVAPEWVAEVLHRLIFAAPLGAAARVP